MDDNTFKYWRDDNESPIVRKAWTELFNTRNIYAWTVTVCGSNFAVARPGFMHSSLQHRFPAFHIFFLPKYLARAKEMWRNDDGICVFLSSCLDLSSFFSSQGLPSLFFNLELNGTYEKPMLYLFVTVIRLCHLLFISSSTSWNGVPCPESQRWDMRWAKLLNTWRFWTFWHQKCCVKRCYFGWVLFAEWPKLPVTQLDVSAAMASSSALVPLSLPEGTSIVRRGKCWRYGLTMAGFCSLPIQEPPAPSRLWWIAVFGSCHGACFATSARSRFLRLDFGQDGLEIVASGHLPIIEDQINWSEDLFLEFLHADIAPGYGNPMALANLLEQLHGVVQYHLVFWNCHHFSTLVWRHFIPQLPAHIPAAIFPVEDSDTDHTDQATVNPPTIEFLSQKGIL